MPNEPTALRASVTLLLVTVAVVGSNSLSLGPIAPDVAAGTDSSVHQVLRASAAYGLGTAFSAFFLARYIDRIGVRISLVWASALLCLSMIASTMSGTASFVLLIPAAALWGLVNHLALNVLVPALNAADDTRRGSVMGLYSCVTYLSLSAGTVLFGLIYIGTAILNLCLLSAMICLGAAIIGYFWSDRKIPEPLA